MKGEKQVIERLNEALFLELGAVNQYWVHYRLLEDWGYTKLAKKERAESIEEMNHADKLVARQAFVTVGRRSGEMVEIVKGLKAGDRVVIAGQNRLSNGTPVKPDNSVAPLDAGADSE